MTHAVVTVLTLGSAYVGLGSASLAATAYDYPLAQSRWSSLAKIAFWPIALVELAWVQSRDSRRESAK